MADPYLLNPHPPEFDRFLHASVGDDRNGFAVTVLSTLARLGLDPWHETADLVALSRDAARTRLAALLARFRDVPALASDSGRIAQDLSQLLPAAPAAGALHRAGAAGEFGRRGTGRAIWALLAIVFLVFQLIMVGGLGSGA